MVTMPLVPALGRQRQSQPDWSTNSFRPARATMGPCLKEKVAFLLRCLENCRFSGMDIDGLGVSILKGSRML